MTYDVKTCKMTQVRSAFMNKTNIGANTNIIQILLDILIILISFGISVLFKRTVLLDNQIFGTFVLSCIFALIYILSNKEENVYDVTLFYYLDRIHRKITKSFFVAAISTSAILYYIVSLEVHKDTFIIFMIISYVLLCVNVFFFRKFLDAEFSKKIPRTFLIGKPGSYNKFNYFLKKTSIRIEIIGYVAFNKEEMLEDNYLGSVEDLEELIKKHNIDQIYVMQKSEVPLPEVQKYIDICVDMGVTVRLVIDFYKRRRANSYVSTVGTYPVVTYHTISLNNYEQIIKRIIDFIGGLVGIVLFSPIMLITAIFIKLDSPGPVVFKQIRVGQNGRRFRIYKFRSMYIDAEERKKELMAQNEIEGGQMFKMKDDPRITKVGKFIRKTSIDELPQFFNVFQGTMSLVGTRPPTLDEVEKYQRTQWRRISIKPGITGLWQVSGRSSIKTFEEVVLLDTEYIDNWNLLLDVKIILKTVVVLFQKGSAY